MVGGDQMRDVSGDADGSVSTSFVDFGRLCHCLKLHGSDRIRRKFGGRWYIGFHSSVGCASRSPKQTIPEAMATRAKRPPIVEPTGMTKPTIAIAAAQISPLPIAIVLINSFLR